MWDNVEKSCVAGQATDNNTHNRVHALACWISKATYALSMCNTRCFSTTTMVIRLRIYVMLIRTFSVLFFPLIQPEFEADHSLTYNEEVMQEYALLLAVRT